MVLLDRLFSDLKKLPLTNMILTAKKITCNEKKNEDIIINTNNYTSRY